MYETTADLNEAIHYERLDADLEMAQYEAEARHYAARRARGICDHNGSALGHKSPSFYSAEDIAGMLEPTAGSVTGAASPASSPTSARATNSARTAGR